jgi:glycosyltransferase involved in cell wall biosynthesis
MRIAFVLFGDLDRVSGGFIYDRLLIDHLRARGDVVDVVPLPWWTLTPALAANLLPFPRALGGYDLVLQDELCHPAVFLRNRRLRRAGIPVVALVHNLGSAQPAARGRRLATAVERRYLRTVDGVVAVCESTREDVQALIGHPVPVAVAPAGRDHVAAAVDHVHTHMHVRTDDAAVAARARARAAGPLRVLMAAAVIPGKGLHRLLEALRRIEDGSVHLDVAGALDRAPAYARQMQARVAALGLQDRVRLHGELRGEALWALFRGSHVLALPSDREAYPLAAVEALGFGLPVLVTDQGGAREVIGTGAQGQCLPPDDVAAWAAALAALAADRERLATAGAAALRRFRELPTWADTASRVQALCARVIAAR